MASLVETYRGRPANEWPPLFYRILERRIQDYHRRGKIRRRVLKCFGMTRDEDGDAADFVEQYPDHAGLQPEQLTMADEAERRLVQSAAPVAPGDAGPASLPR